jgi:hypothetical protein
MMLKTSWVMPKKISLIFFAPQNNKRNIDQFLSPMSSCSTTLSSQGRGPELKYEFYFPPAPPANSAGCLPDPTIKQSLSTCRKIGYPLMTQPTCPIPCMTAPAAGPDPKLVPSDLWGDSVGFNGGDGIYYYQDPHAPKSLSVLTYGQGMQPMHYRNAV